MTSWTSKRWRLRGQRRTLKIRKARQAAGLCPYCEEKVEPGKLACKRHLRMKARNTRRYRFRMSQLLLKFNPRLCPRCLLEEKAPGKSSCQTCLDYRKNRRVQQRAEWDAAGLCTGCGGERTNKSKKTCIKCRKKDSERRSGKGASEAQKKRQKDLTKLRHKNHECTRCGRKLKQELDGPNNTCARCRKKYRKVA